MTLNERISEWFEPRPELPPDIADSDLSPKQAWHYVCINSYTGEWGWVAFSWDTDEAANARLLEAMPDPILRRMTKGWGCEYEELLYTDPDRKTAVMMAFRKFMAARK